MKTKIEVGENYFKSNSMYLKNNDPTEYVTVIEKINDNHFIVQTDENIQGDAFDFELFTNKKDATDFFNLKIKNKIETEVSKISSIKQLLEYPFKKESNANISKDEKLIVMFQSAKKLELINTIPDEYNIQGED